MGRRKKGLSTIVSEAIILSIVVAWMGIIASLPNTMETVSTTKRSLVLLPLYCSEKMVLAKVVKSGYIRIMGNYSAYILLQNSTTRIGRGEYYLQTDTLLLVNSTQGLNRSLVFPTDAGFIVIEIDDCITQYK